MASSTGGSSFGHWVLASFSRLARSWALEKNLSPPLCNSTLHSQSCPYTTDRCSQHSSPKKPFYSKWRPSQKSTAEDNTEITPWEAQAQWTEHLHHRSRSYGSRNVTERGRRQSDYWEISCETCPENGSYARSERQQYQQIC